MNGQQGSILAGVVGLTVGITAALAAFLVVAGSSNRLEADSESETQLHYSAQSAMTMGLRWLRIFPDTKTNDLTWPATAVCLNSMPGNFTIMDGVWVKVVFFATPGEYQNHRIRCFATMGSGRDTLEINYYLASTDMNSSKIDGNGATLYQLNMGQWRETIHPGHL
jgi:hypothetical protein